MKAAGIVDASLPLGAAALCWRLALVLTRSPSETGSDAQGANAVNTRR